MDGMTASQIRAAVHKDSAKTRCTPIYCTRREASDPIQVDTSTIPWNFNQGVTHTPTKISMGTGRGSSVTHS